MWMNSRTEMEILYDLITTKAAEALGVKGHVLEEAATLIWSY